MKKLTTIVTSLLLMLVSLQSNASLIQLNADQASYETGETVLIDIFMKDLSLNTTELEFNLDFDNTEIAFDSFTFSDDVFDSTPIAYADLFNPDAITFYVAWFSSIDLPAASFSLGQVSFTSLQAYNPKFDLTNIFVGDDSGNLLDTPSYSTNVPVPEPSTSLIMLFSLLILPLQKKLSAQRK